MAKIERISLDTSKEVCVTNVILDVVCDACGPCNAMWFSLFTVISIHGIHKITIIRNSKKLNKMESSREDSTT